jgi:hypothetical protein
MRIATVEMHDGQELVVNVDGDHRGVALRRRRAAREVERIGMLRNAVAAA